jgi:hypothetical protein
MPYQTKGKRDYKKELNWEKKNKPNRVKDRTSRNAARKQAGLKVGDSRQVDHKDNNPRNNSKKNIRVVAKKTNLKKEAMRKKRG